MAYNMLQKHHCLRIRSAGRRGFTLIELLIAGIIASFIVGTSSLALSGIVKTKNVSQLRLNAHLRAHTALTQLRNDLVSMMRSDDLFYSQFLLNDMQANGYERDEFLVYSNSFKPLRDTHHNGEGNEYEIEYRIEENDFGINLKQRKDAVIDEIYEGGGIVTPIAESIIELNIEAYDGERWLPSWDSDLDGLPHAIRIHLTASGNRIGQDPYDATNGFTSYRGRH